MRRANEDIKMILMRLFVCIENGKNGINANGEARRTMELTLIAIVAITAGGL